MIQPLPLALGEARPPSKNPFRPPRIDRMVQVVDFFCLSSAYFYLTSISCHIGLYTAELQCNSLCILQIGLTPICILRTAQRLPFQPPSPNALILRINCKAARSGMRLERR